MLEQAIELISNFANTHIYFFYVLLYLFCILSGLGFPISSDLLFLAVSYLIFTHKVGFVTSSVIGIAGIMTGDIIMYSLGRRSTELKFFKTNEALLSRGQRFIEKYGAFGVFLARFFPGIRTVVFFSAGVLKVKRRNFIAADLLGAVIVIPLLLYSLTYLAGNMEPLKVLIGQFQAIAYVLIVLFLTTILVAIYRLKAKNK